MEFPSGCNGVELRNLTPILVYSSLFKPEIRLVALSDTKILGIPILVNISNNASQASLAVNVFNGKASTHRDAESIKQIMYLCPLDDFDSNGPIKSIDT